MHASTGNPMTAPDAPRILYGALRRARSWATSLIFVAIVFGPLLALLGQTAHSTAAGDLGDAAGLVLGERQAVLLGRSLGLDRLASTVDDIGETVG